MQSTDRDAATEMLGRSCEQTLAHACTWGLARHTRYIANRIGSLAPLPQPKDWLARLEAETGYLARLMAVAHADIAELRARLEGLSPKARHLVIAAELLQLRALAKAKRKREEGAG